MSKEEEVLKRIELKVSVDCCDGCKKRVKKTLKRVDGVLKVIIDQTEPKVTVIGNVDEKILIKKLVKSGKACELWATENLKDEDEEKKKSESHKNKVKVDHSDPKKMNCEAEKVSNQRTSDKANSNRNSDEGDNRMKKEDTEASKHSNSNEIISEEDIWTANPPLPLTNNPINSLMVTNMGNIPSHAQFYYIMEAPRASVLPHYSMRNHPVPHMYVQNSCPCEFPPSNVAGMPSMQRMADYFNDENTVGCLIM